VGGSRHPEGDTNQAAESECCSWANWTVDRRDEELVLGVGSGTEEGAAALHGMLDGFWPQQP
jgi:hypothetical protein